MRQQSQSCPASCVRGRDGDARRGPWRLPDRMSDITGSLTSPRPRPPPDADPRRAVEVYGERYRANPKDADAALALRPGAARHRAARPGRRRARTGHHRQSRQQGAARRLRPRAGRQRQFPAGLRRARPRAFARQSGLAHPVGAGHRARPARPPRRGPPLLRQRAEDRAGRAVGAVQSRPVLHAVEGSAEGGGDAAPGLWQRARPIRGCGRISDWWSACRAASPRPKPSSRPICRRTRRPPTSPI